MKNVKDLSKKLSDERNTDGKNPLTDEEFLEELYSIRDGSAKWLKQCIVYGKKDGIKEAQSLMDHAILTIAKIKRNNKIMEKKR